VSNPGSWGATSATVSVIDSPANHSN
jgi:hypothetical protein